MTPDPKRARRIVSSSAGADKAARERVCRACRSTRRSTAWWYRIQRHHLVPRAQGGDDVAENLVPICPACHDDLEHAGGAIARKVRVALRARMLDEEVAYIVMRKGEGWLDRRYPRA